MIGLLSLVAATGVFAADSAVEPGSFEEKADQFSWVTTPDPALPNVLILGDSITIGYTLEVKKDLNGVANVFRPVTGKEPENCRDTRRSVGSIDRWLSIAPKWDVIYFNWGLHDLAHVNTVTKKMGPDVPNQVPLDEYKKNLQYMVEKMKQTGAKLIFATTTTFPPGVYPCRLPEDVEPYNAAALEVMAQNGVQIDDLYAFTKDRLKELQRSKNVHFTDKGSEVIGKHVAETIAQTLKQ